MPSCVCGVELRHLPLTRRQCHLVSVELNWDIFHSPDGSAILCLWGWTGTPFTHQTAVPSFVCVVNVRHLLLTRRPCHLVSVELNWDTFYSPDDSAIFCLWSQTETSFTHQTTMPSCVCAVKLRHLSLTRRQCHLVSVEFNWDTFHSPNDSAILCLWG